MTDFTNLIDWYEDSGVEDLDIDEFGDFSDSDVQSALLDFGKSKSVSVDEDVAERRLSPVIGKISDNLFDNIKEGRRFISQVATKRELSFYEKLIDARVQAPLAERIGIETAKGILKRDVFSPEAYGAIEFLRRHSPQTLGGVTRQAIRRAGSISALEL